MPSDTQARKVRFFALQPVIVLDGIRIGEQWVGGEEGGVQRDHGGCEHRRTAVRATVQLRPENPGKHSPRDLQDFRMLRINSYTALIFRAATNNKYMAYNKHVLILQYFMAAYQ